VGVQSCSNAPILERFLEIDVAVLGEKLVELVFVGVMKARDFAVELG
jgi:hypothetical protein